MRPGPDRRPHSPYFIGGIIQCRASTGFLPQPFVQIRQSASRQCVLCFFVLRAVGQDETRFIQVHHRRAGHRYARIGALRLGRSCACHRQHRRWPAKTSPQAPAELSTSGAGPDQLPIITTITTTSSSPYHKCNCCSPPCTLLRRSYRG